MQSVVGDIINSPPTSPPQQQHNNPQSPMSNISSPQQQQPQMTSPNPIQSAPVNFIQNHTMVQQPFNPTVPQQISQQVPLTHHHIPNSSLHSSLHNHHSHSVHQHHPPGFAHHHTHHPHHHHHPHHSSSHHVSNGNIPHHHTPPSQNHHHHHHQSPQIHPTHVQHAPPPHHPFMYPHNTPHIPHPVPVNNRKITDQTGCDVETFLVNTLKQNPRDRLTIYTLEKDMIDFCSNPAIHGIRFPKMTSYHRMLVHRIATYFGLDHNVDDTGRMVVCHKGANTRIPSMRLEDLVKISEQKDMIRVQQKVQHAQQQQQQSQQMVQQRPQSRSGSIPSGSNTPRHKMVSGEDKVRSANNSRTSTPKIHTGYQQSVPNLGVNGIHHQTNPHQYHPHAIQLSTPYVHPTPQAVSQIPQVPQNFIHNSPTALSPLIATEPVVTEQAPVYPFHQPIHQGAITNTIQGTIGVQNHSLGAGAIQTGHHPHPLLNTNHTTLQPTHHQINTSSIQSSNPVMIPQVFTLPAKNIKISPIEEGSQIDDENDPDQENSTPKSYAAVAQQVSKSVENNQRDGNGGVNSPNSAGSSTDYDENSSKPEADQHLQQQQDEAQMAIALAAQQAQQQHAAAQATAIALAQQNAQLQADLLAQQQAVQVMQQQQNTVGQGLPFYSQYTASPQHAYYNSVQSHQPQLYTLPPTTTVPPNTAQQAVPAPTTTVLPPPPQQQQPDLTYFEIKFVQSSADNSPRTLKRLEGEIVLNFLRQQYGGIIYWLPKKQNQEADKTLDVENFNIYLGLQVQLIPQAKQDINNRNLNITLQEIPDANQFLAKLELSQISKVSNSGVESTAATADQELVNGIASVKIAS